MERTEAYNHQGHGLLHIDKRQVDKSPKEAIKFRIQRCIESLVHACQCKKVNCFLKNCPRMKRLIVHIKTCKKRTKGGCPVCKQLVALCCHHAKTCTKSVCTIPFCHNIKDRIKEALMSEKTQFDRKRKILQCKLCSEKEVEHALPCGHLCCCGNCLEAIFRSDVLKEMYRCPVCSISVNIKHLAQIKSFDGDRLNSCNNRPQEVLSCGHPVSCERSHEPSFNFKVKFCFYCRQNEDNFLKSYAKF